MEGKKPSATGSRWMDESLGFGKEKPPIAAAAEEDAPPKDDDVWEAPTGYLRCARHQVFAVELVQKSGVMLVVPYSAIDGAEGKFNGDRFTFRFFRGEAAYEAAIEGTITHTQRVMDKIAGGKAELVRANGDEIRSVTWYAVEAEAEELDEEA